MRYPSEKSEISMDCVIIEASELFSNMAGRHQRLESGFLLFVYCRFLASGPGILAGTLVLRIPTLDDSDIRFWALGFMIC